MACESLLKKNIFKFEFVKYSLGWGKIFCCDSSWALCFPKYKRKDIEVEDRPKKDLQVFFLISLLRIRS